MDIAPRALAAAAESGAAGSADPADTAARAGGWRATAWRWVLAVAFVVIAAFPFLPEAALVPVYQAVGFAAVAAIVAGVRIHRLARPLPWLLLAAGQLLFVAGDLAWSVDELVLEERTTLSAADALYLLGFPFIAAAFAILTRRRSPGGDAAGVIDASIVTIGAAVVAWVFVIAPSTADATVPLADQLSAVAYPLGDLLVLAMGARLFLVPGAGGHAQRLLGAGLVVVLLTDAAYAGVTVAGGGPLDVLAVGWLASYVLVGAAALHPSARHVADRTTARGPELSTLRLGMLATAALLAPATLAIQTASGETPDGMLIAGTSAAVFLLVILRMSGLVRRVEEQAAELSRVARTDALTGIPNRRGWDEQLAVELARGARADTPVCVALLDLDHFKAFNDLRGHPAGDRLLREVAAAWRSELRTMDVLARYGGEEFGLILPGCGPQAAAAIVDRLRALTPSGQTTSAGVVCWDGDETPDALVARADLALYEAKRGGRDRTVLAGPSVLHVA